MYCEVVSKSNYYSIIHLPIEKHHIIQGYYHEPIHFDEYYDHDLLCKQKGILLNYRFNINEELYKEYQQSYHSGCEYLIPIKVYFKWL